LTHGKSEIEREKRCGSFAGVYVPWKRKKAESPNTTALIIARVPYL